MTHCKTESYLLIYRLNDIKLLFAFVFMMCAVFGVWSHYMYLTEKKKNEAIAVS